MIGIEDIGYFIPDGRISNYERKEQFSIDDNFIENKIGIKRISQKSSSEETSDLCVKAFEALEARSKLNRVDIEALVVVTQNPDKNIPHTSAIVHDKLDLPSNCACYDISLGCSGFVYGLSVFEAFMSANGLKKGVLITADPYSKVVDPTDKNTALLFGDAAAATLVSDDPVFVSGATTFGTIGKDRGSLEVDGQGYLHMNGRAVFNFAAKTIPKDLCQMAEKNQVNLQEIDCFLLHQGSKIIVETIANKLGIEKTKVPYKIQETGNTIGSSIPLLLQDELNGPANLIAISGFGVGLSWASSLLRRVAIKPS
ncbi:3-oxoacyl-ACP synthase III family protein [Malonomonas rubra]|uniref:3-oxoacyl-ACP synthase III family protein n=1 Tax=Malonomonas rubra TaxID=57040 RepID=UPI0026EEF43D|nr:ketoacyl-ACP synthase III [Malonomonas rubra]